MNDLSAGAAILWFIGVAALFLVVIPLVLILVQKVLRSLGEIRSYATDVLEHIGGVTDNLESVPALLQTRDLVKSVGGGLGRYVGNVSRLL